MNWYITESDVYHLNSPAFKAVSSLSPRRVLDNATV